MSDPPQPQAALPFKPQAGLPPSPGYRAVSVKAVVSLLCGLLSGLVVVDWLLAIIPVAGIVLGVWARRQIRRAPEVWLGAGLARAGLILSVLGVMAGVGWHFYAQAKAVPHGYTAVSYAELASDSKPSGEEIPARALELEGQKVYVKGYMYPGRLQTGIKQFVISHDDGSCTFCKPNPKSTDLILVTLMGDLETRYMSHLMGVGGTLRIEKDPAKRAADGVAYRLEADYLP